MTKDEFENRMRKNEIYHSIKVNPDNWIILRLDGRNFSKLTETNFHKPFSIKFRDYMVESALSLFKDFDGVFGYTESDEISIVFAPHFNIFDREVEKLVSVSSSIVSSNMSLYINKPVQFDSRIWIGESKSDVIDYFKWRQADSLRNALNSYCYWNLIYSGLTKKQATNRLKNIQYKEKLSLIKEECGGSHFFDIPDWQRKGVGIYWKEVVTQGYNPHDKEFVTVKRRRLEVDYNIPEGKSYENYIMSLLGE